MKAAGVITEYNPFHNGHKYQLEQIRKQTGSDYIIVVMSGNFVQRGQPAIIDKYSRTRMALKCGADLVIEMPAVCATASAEYFAAGGIEVLKNTGVVDTLCYGVETADHDMAKLIAGVLKNPPDEYSARLKDYMQSGMSFPAARSKALSEFLIFSDKYTDINDCSTSCEHSDIADFISSPNNILAIEYEKALIGTDITGFPIQRIGEGYHSINSDSELASATAIRKLLFTSDTASDVSRKNAQLSHIMPLDCADILLDSFNAGHIVSPDAISDMLYYRILSEKDMGFEKYADCTKELSSKIIKNIYRYESFTQFCELLKSKNLTYARISRVLIHILLGIENESHLSYYKMPYLRVLGFKKSSAALMHEIKKRASAPLITKVADAPYDLIAKDIFAADVYNRLCANSYNEFTNGIVIV
ncbi:nucleotidyltransferase [Agathobacter sp.]